MARQYYKDSTTGQMKPLGVKVEDTLPVGTEVDYDGQDIPEGWVEVNPIIWTNSSPSSDFAGQTITFSTSGYDMYKLFYRMNKTYTYMKSEELIVGQRGILTIPHTDGFNADPVSRWITSITNNSITFGNASIDNATNNNYLIPIYVIGYKTGLFS